MKIHIAAKENSEIRFIVEGIEPSFANEFRRIMTSEIPTMAVEFVDFVKNDSALNDEIVANRLGQVPLTFDKSYNLPKECKCDGKGCSLCQVRMTLKKKGPAVVYSGDLKSSAKDVTPVFDRSPITELFENQEIEFEAIASLGLGKDHTKWQGAIVGYSNLFDAKSKASEMKLCDNHMFHVKGVKGTRVDPVDCSLCKSLNEDGDEFKPVEDSFLFTVETASGLSPEEIITESVGILEDKLKDFDKSLKKLK
ncbi:MAG: DNA-directed RNA polymerase subunit D [Candidatus Aenigmarchaeota archaeon]|nr:DNA-directed RNA polymerase subunit D [Candidatus Aenigmarchaeota archaeon]